MMMFADEIETETEGTLLAGAIAYFHHKHEPSDFSQFAVKLLTVFAGSLRNVIQYRETVGVELFDLLPPHPIRCWHPDRDIRIASRSLVMTVADHLDFALGTPRRPMKPLGEEFAANYDFDDDDIDHDDDDFDDDQPQYLDAHSSTRVYAFDAGTVELTAAAGKRPTFTMTAYNGGPMEVGGFSFPVAVDVSGVQTTDGTVVMLWNHNPDLIVGQGDAVMDGPRILVNGSIMGNSDEAQQIVALARDGFKWQGSIGANITRREFVDTGKTAIVNGMQVTGPLIVARESLLREVSFVALGADAKTSAEVKANLVKLEARWCQ